MTTVFLFAHQDDEMGVFQTLQTLAARGEQQVCIYLTNGDWNGLSPILRNAESSRVLEGFGVAPGNIYFLGTDLGISDGTLPDNLVLAFTALDSILEKVKPQRIILPAWEGGHQDHDGLHWLGAQLAQKLGILHASRQFSLYRATSSGFIPYRVMAPLHANGKLEYQPVSMMSAFRHAVTCFSYKTQRKAMLGLVPWMLLDQLLSRSERLQPVLMARIEQRPHLGLLLYEKRGRYCFSQMTTALLRAGDAIRMPSQ